ncbi:MAG: hypothetical protein HUU43_11525 [Ignavibacteriaceae bacterium]|nr:hypothetical protein [Ignavibacteriaceae bacterium]
MSSKERLRTVFAELTEWPRDNMSIDENIADLRRHEHEFNNRIAFVYSVFNKSRENYIGCLYIEPGGKKVYDSAVFMWVSNMFTESDEILFSEAKRRIADYWPFKNPAYPGREITWSEWETIR